MYELPCGVYEMSSNPLLNYIGGIAVLFQFDFFAGRAMRASCSEGQFGCFQGNSLAREGLRLLVGAGCFTLWLQSVRPIDS